MLSISRQTTISGIGTASLEWIIPKFSEFLASKSSPETLGSSPEFGYGPSGIVYQLTLQSVEGPDMESVFQLRKIIRKPFSSQLEKPRIAEVYTKTNEGKVILVSQSILFGQFNWFHIPFNKMIETGLKNDGSLQICFEVSYLHHGPSTDEDIYWPGEVVDETKVFRSLYKDQSSKDCTIKFNDERFAVHHCVLAAHSELFIKMLTKTRSITLIETDLKSVLNLVYFLYNGQLQTENEEVVLNTFFLAKKYNVEELKKRCEMCMVRDISPLNILDKWSFSYYYDAKYVRKCAAEYFHKNFNRVRHVMDWKDFKKKNPAMASDFMEAALSF